MLLMESLLESIWKFRRARDSVGNPYWNPYGTSFGEWWFNRLFFLLIFASPSMKSVNIHTNFSYETPQSSGVDPHRNRRVLHMDSIPESVWKIFAGTSYLHFPADHFPVYHFPGNYIPENIFTRVIFPRNPLQFAESNIHESHFPESDFFESHFPESLFAE
jgi:hypothetical protein